jgi:hypothetical protein
MSGTIPLLPLCALMLWTGKILPLFLYVFGNKETVNFMFTHEGVCGSQGISPFILKSGTKLSHEQMGNRFLCPQKNPDRLLDTSNLLFDGYRRLFPQR